MFSVTATHVAMCRIPGAHHLGTSYPELDLAVLGLCDHSIIDFGTFGIWVCTRED